MNKRNIWKVLPNKEVNKKKRIFRKSIKIKEVPKENAPINIIKDSENTKIEEKNIIENEKETNSTKEKNFINKKRGRKRKKSLNKNENKEHDKFSHDNLKRKVKTHFHLFIITLLNMYSKDILSKRNRFGKISSEITQNITVEFNQNLFKKKIKDVIVKVSDKFQDKEKNIISLELIMRNNEKNKEVLKLLDMNYKDMYLNYYLKSTKNTFEGYSEDESYESHIIKLRKKYGKEYAIEYQNNAEGLINFFDTCQKRVRKKVDNSLKIPNFAELSKNNPNFLYNINNFKDDINPNTRVSTYTQTNMILSDDEEDF